MVKLEGGNGGENGMLGQRCYAQRMQRRQMEKRGSRFSADAVFMERELVFVHVALIKR